MLEWKWIENTRLKMKLKLVLTFSSAFFKCERKIVGLSFLNKKQWQTVEHAVKIQDIFQSELFKYPLRQVSVTQRI